MIRCNKCGYIGEYTGIYCPECRERFVFTKEETESKLREINRAMAARDFETAEEGYRILADMGHTQSEREYADMLERGEVVARNLDLAMKYFYRAAEKNDSYSAYRYSKLAGRHSSGAKDFWLAYSAVLGCALAYPDLADELSRSGDEEAANYYYALAAACDDTDAIVTLAKRYYNGIGAERSEPYAKWYLDKLNLPPIHAIKMAYKRRSVKAEDPGMPKLADYDRMLRRLAIMARGLGYKSAYHRLCSLLSDRQDMQARMILGMLYAEGVGTKQDTNEAIELLASAAAHGNAEAYKHLGDIYLAGKLVTADSDKSLEYYRLAAGLGMTNAYETMGDIFREGKLVERNIPRAIELYDMAAKEGHESARAKSEALCQRREEFFTRAEALLQSNPNEAFRLFAVSTGMGYIPAHIRLGACYEKGIGIKKDRQRAFLWYNKAKEAGSKEALLPLGICYARGIGTAFDFNLAIKTLTLAKRYGYNDAGKEIVKLYENKKKHMARAAYAKGMELIHQKKFKEAEKTLLICLRTGDGKGIYTLGCLNEFGLGIPTNRERAFALYEAAFDLRFRDPRAVYKLRILKMARNYK